MPDWIVPIAAARSPAARWAGPAASVLNRVLGWFFRRFNLGFDVGDQGLYWSPWPVLLRVSAGRAAGLRRAARPDLLGFTTTPDRVHPAAGQGLPARQRAAARRRLAGAHASRQMRRLEEIARQTPGVEHTVAIAGQSLLLNANAPNFGSMYVMLDEFHAPPRARPAAPTRSPAKLQASSQRGGRRGGRQRLRRAAGRRPGHRRRLQAHRRGPRRHRPRRTLAAGRPRAGRGRRRTTPELARRVHQLPRRHALAVPGHRPRRGPDDGRVDGRGRSTRCRSTSARSTSTTSTASAGPGR